LSMISSKRIKCWTHFWLFVPARKNITSLCGMNQTLRPCKKREHARVAKVRRRQNRTTPLCGAVSRDR
jgi:hypothetical protein